MKLTDKLEDTIVIDMVQCKIDMSFDNILRFYELYDDNEVSNEDKIDYMFEMLVIHEEKIDISLEQKKEVIEYIINNIIAKEETYNSIEDVDAGTEEANQKQKEYDIIKDADLIYASFMHDYKIDLFEEHGKLHWKKFIALLNGLSEKTPFMNVVQIRTMEIPKPNKYNQKDRQKIIKLKRYYALEEQQTLQDGLGKAVKFFGSMKPKAGDK